MLWFPVLQLSVFQSVRMMECVLLLDTADVLQSGRETDVKEVGYEYNLFYFSFDCLLTFVILAFVQRHANHHARMVVAVIMAPVSARPIGRDQCANQVHHNVINKIIKRLWYYIRLYFLKLFVNHHVLMEERVLHQTTAPVLLDGEDLAVNQVGGCT